MSNSELISLRRISPNKTSPRRGKIEKITIHHMAANYSIETCLASFANPKREASANYVIGSDGRIGLCVDEKDRAWTSGNAANDNVAVTIEVANDGGAPDWHVSDKALRACIDLCVDICRRNGIERLNFTGDKSGNLTAHRYFQATLCPGPYLYGKFPYIANEVNNMLIAYKVKEEYEMEKKQIEAIVDEKLEAFKTELFADKSAAPGWAKTELEAAIANGFTDGTRPNAPMKRLEGAIIVQRLWAKVKPYLDERLLIAR